MLRSLGLRAVSAARPGASALVAQSTPLARLSAPAAFLLPKRSITSEATPKVVDTTPLKLATELYAEFRVHGRPYVVTEGDRVILPYKVKNAEVGDTLNLTDVRAIGSRNYKLVDEPISPELYTLKATVIEKTKRKFEVREVTKRRSRRVRHAKSKGDLTMIRISELSVK